MGVERRRYFRTLLLLLAATILLAPFWWNGGSAPQPQYKVQDGTPPEPISTHNDSIAVGYPIVDLVDHESTYVPDSEKYRIIYSRTTRDGRYFSVDFAGEHAYNVNIIPHPTDVDKYIVIAQANTYRDDIGSSEELVCTAIFVGGVLHCPEWPTALPLAPSILGQCEGELAYANMRRGPRDARVFYGPEAPYIVYGTQSQYVCIGIWVQDLRLLLDGWKHPNDGFFRGPTELRRPLSQGQVEKNYFLFWDTNGTMYVHYDTWPRRSFSEVKYDGTPVSANMTFLDLAQFSEDKDAVCLEKYMPTVKPGKDESIHQATNSLSITMCNRADSSCVPDDDNTFIAQIFHYKTYYVGHGRYEPYVLLFKRRPPFEIHAISSKALWFHGRERLTEKTDSVLYKLHPDWTMPQDHTEMFYTTSMTWKGLNRTYHGYLDDTLFLGFGIEDTRSAAIDVLAKDILQDLQFC